MNRSATFIPYSFGLSLCLLPLFSQAQDKITYADHIQPILQNKCFSCHNPDKLKGGLDLTTFGATMKGGSGGAVAEANDISRSRIYTLTARKAEPYMPGEGDPVPPGELELIVKWINGGLLETKNSTARKSTRPVIDLKVAGTAKPEGPPPMPENILQEPVVITRHGSTITALAASPWAPLIAVSGQKQVLLYDTDQQLLVGVLPYPEGYIRSLQFSRNGSLLIGGGGRGGKNGNAVIWDVKTGRRITEIGKEFDSVLTASLSPDQTRLVIGTTAKRVKAYSVATGEEQYVVNRHSEWVQAVEISPDGVLLASSDRNGGLYVWEASTGNEMYTLAGHTASITDLAWRSDSNLLATVSEDGSLHLWEMSEGKEFKKWNPHGGAGVLSVRFTADGNIVTAGRDKTVRVWDVNGTEQAKFTDFPDLITKVTTLSDSKHIIAGDWFGNLRELDLMTKKEFAQLSSAPAKLATRREEAVQAAKDAEVAQQQVVAACTEADKALVAAQTEKQQAEAGLGAKKQRVNQIAAEIKAINEQHIPAANKVVAVATTAVEEQMKANTAFDASTQIVNLVETSRQQALQKVQELEKQVTEAQKKNAKGDQKLATQLVKAKREFHVQEVALDMAKKGLNQQPKPLTETQSQVDKAQADLKALQDQLVALANEQKQLPEQIKAAEKQLPELDKKIAAVAKLKEEAVAKAKATEANIALSKKKIVLIDAAIFNVGVLKEKDALGKLEAEQAAMISQLEDAQKGLPNYKNQMEGGRKKLADATELLKLREAEVVKLTEPAKAAEDAFRKASAEASTQLAASKDKLDSLEKAARDASEKLARVQCTYDDTRNALAKATAARDEAKAAADTAQKEVTNAQKSAQEAEQTLASLPPKKIQTEQQLTQQKAKVEDLQKKYLALLPK